jgi:integrase
LVTYTNLQEYILYLINQKYDNGTTNNYIKGIKLFYKSLTTNTTYLTYLTTNNLPNKQEELLSIVDKLKLLPYERKIKDYFVLEELDNVIEMVCSFYSINPFKLKAILYFFYFTGVRKGELIKLKRIDISLEEHNAIIRGTKNRLQRIVLFPARLVPILSDYFKTDEETLNAFNLELSQIDYLAKISKQFTPKKNFTLHNLRHSFARMLAKNQIDSRIAQKLLGHKDIASTMIYYDPDIDVIQAIYNKKIK